MMKKNTILTFALLISSSVFASENEHREHGAHQHGQAQLNVILEKNDLMVMLETPAMNIFGFEHEPKNEEQKKVVELAIKDIEKITPYFKTDQSAECKIVKIDVDQPFTDHEEKDSDEHEAEHEKHEESAHSDVDIEIAFNCQQPSKLTQLDLTDLFKRFPGFQELDAQIISNGQQNAVELTKEQTVLELKK